jgi:hypothetical protein
VSATPDQPPRRFGPLFWIVSLALVAYVACCTPFRDSLLEADAWEHHRAIAALARGPWHPGNPTFAVDEPSIRYSPGAVAMAAVSRATGIDPWDIQSADAVLNTALLCLGVGTLLRALGRADAAGLALLVMVSLYGGAPGYANSYALADLPWHQVNPSALAFGLVLLSWALFLRLRSGVAPRVARLGWLALPLMLGVALLEHAMTGVLGFLGLAFFALFAGEGSPAVRLRRLAMLAAVGAGAAALCLAWPWYSFLRAVLSRPDTGYWFNPAILRTMLTQWCAPAVLLSAWAITARDRAGVLLLLGAGFATLALGVLAVVGRSPTLARLPLPGLIFFHLAIAIAAADHRVLSLRAWRERAFDLLIPGGGTALAGFTLAACATIIYFLLPQLAAIPREPHLARAYIAPLLHREDKQPRLRERYREVLAPVGEREVVLAESPTAWPVPSFGPRIVAASHYEFFVNGQDQRERDVKRFFETGHERERTAVIDAYGASWILLDESRLSARQRSELLRDRAVERRVGPLVLMNAARWRSP